MSDKPEVDHPRVVEIIRQAVNLEAENDTAFAKQILASLVEEFPKVAIAHGYLAWILSRTGRHREAIEHGRVAIQLEPTSERVSMLYFRVLWGAGERNDALNEVKRFTAVGHSDEYSRMLEEWAQIDD
ncbi:MAG: BTAD domain-containing putative transcriptional regulator [Terracidiphilus sp.]|jgi:predicted Zn-dependent protease